MSNINDITREELQGLPEALLNELSISKKTEDLIVIEIFRKYGPILSVNRVLLFYYRETGEVLRRTSLYSRLYRLKNNGILFKHPNIMNVFSLEEIEG